MPQHGKATGITLLIYNMSREIVLLYFCQMLNDFKNSLTVRHVGKYAIKLSLSIPPYLTNVSTLPCEILMTETSGNMKHVL